MGSHSGLGRVVSEELPEEVALSRDLRAAEDYAMQKSEGRVFRQREQHVWWPWYKATLGSKNSKKRPARPESWERRLDR